MESPYRLGFTNALLKSAGATNSDVQVEEALDRLEKHAAMFNFGDRGGSDYGDSGVFGTLLPLLAIAATGYIGYKSGLNGSKTRSAFDNVQKYIYDTVRPLIRKANTPQMYDPADSVNR